MDDKSHGESKLQEPLTLVGPLLAVLDGHTSAVVLFAGEICLGELSLDLGSLGPMDRNEVIRYLDALNK